MHTYLIAILVMLAICKNTVASETDTLVLSLQDAIHLARQQSPSAQSARNAFLSAYWNYRYYRANYLPSVTLTSSPYINKEMNKITQSYGTAQFIQQDQFGAGLMLKVNQNISLTGDSINITQILKNN